ncbi:response regulator transcription factor [Flavobacterium selenitireducens]|uniref:response regulator transcription factor n=1 Tax=Flavobacterium selenitireducens TaxID=2722704 RepID=UPI0038CBFB85
MNSSKANEAACARAGISKREMEVLERLAKGYSNAEIAAELFVSLNTVKTHVSNILSKLEVSRRTQAIAKSKRIGLLSS